MIETEYKTIQVRTFVLDENELKKAIITHLENLDAEKDINKIKMLPSKQNSNTALNLPIIIKNKDFSVKFEIKNSATKHNEISALCEMKYK